MHKISRTTYHLNLLTGCLPTLLLFLRCTTPLSILETPMFLTALLLIVFLYLGPWFTFCKFLINSF